jgi:hypothetical protein
MIFLVRGVGEVCASMYRLETGFAQISTLARAFSSCLHWRVPAYTDGVLVVLLLW